MTCAHCVTAYYFLSPVSLLPSTYRGRAVTKQPCVSGFAGFCFWLGVGSLIVEQDWNWLAKLQVHGHRVPHSQRLVLRTLRLVPQGLFCSSIPFPASTAVAAGYQTGNLAWVKAIQLKNKIWVCTRLCFLIWFRTAPPARPGPEQEAIALFLRTAGACASSPLACVMPQSPPAAHCSVLRTWGRGGRCLPPWWWLPGVCVVKGLTRLLLKTFPFTTQTSWSSSQNCRLSQSSFMSPHKLDEIVSSV